MKRVIGIALGVACLPVAFAQAQYLPPPSYPPPPYAAPMPEAPPLPEATQPIYAPQQLDQMLASIALYPDPLLTNILTAATYPEEVADADRWVTFGPNAALRGGALEAALQNQPWEPSVKSLVPFPQILHMMGEHPDWTEALGSAFLAQQAAVMDSIQRLRQAAMAAGTLVSNNGQRVIVDGPYIRIEPASEQTVYIPVYDPDAVYGAWPYPAYQPIYYGPPPGLVYQPVPTGIAFGVGIVVVDRFWRWGRWDWRQHRIDLDRERFNHINAGRPPIAATTWRHDPARRPLPPMPAALEFQPRHPHPASAPVRPGVPPPHPPVPPAVNQARPVMPSHVEPFGAGSPAAAATREERRFEPHPDGPPPHIQPGQPVPPPGTPPAPQAFSHGERHFEPHPSGPPPHTQPTQPVPSGAAPAPQALHAPSTAPPLAAAHAPQPRHPASPQHAPPQLVQPPATAFASQSPHPTPPTAAHLPPHQAPQRREPPTVQADRRGQIGEAHN